MRRNDHRLRSYEKDEAKKRKTYKREFAGFLFCFVAFFAIYYVFWGNDRAMEVLNLFVTPIFVFLYGAFSIDSASKQFGFYKDFKNDRHEWRGDHRDPFESHRNDYDHNGNGHQKYERKDHGHGF